MHVNFMSQYRCTLQEKAAKALNKKLLGNMGKILHLTLIQVREIDLGLVVLQPLST